MGHTQKIIELKEDLPKIEKELLEYQKRELKIAVEMQIKHIDLHRNQVKEHLTHLCDSGVGFVVFSISYDFKMVLYGTTFVYVNRKSLKI